MFPKDQKKKKIFTVYNEKEKIKKHWGKVIMSFKNSIIAINFFIFVNGTKTLKLMMS